MFLSLLRVFLYLSLCNLCLFVKTSLCVLRVSVCAIPPWQVSSCRRFESPSLVVRAFQATHLYARMRVLATWDTIK